MSRQSKLVLLMLLSIGAYQVALIQASNIKPEIHWIKDEITENDLSEEDVKTDYLKSTKVVELPSTSDSSSLSSSSAATPRLPPTPVPETSTTTRKQISDEHLQDLIEASRHSDLLADDLRFNKMLPEKVKVENSTSPTTDKKTEENYEDDYDDDYSFDEDYDDQISTVIPLDVDKSKSDKSKNVEMKPIVDNEKISKTKDAGKKSDQTESDHMANDDLDDDDYYEEDDDEDDEVTDHINDIADEEDIVFSENVPCPRYCECARNINSYLVATCSRLDPGTQKFGSDITDIVVTDVGPKYPILLGPDFFLQLGLKHVSSIKIANCTVEYLHPSAFNGLDELYAVNLTNVGLSIINPDTFSKNKKLRLLTISGNDLSIMSSIPYLLKSNSIEELDLSRNNLMELNQNAFSKLRNIVYINLSRNSLQKIPENVFDPVETIEELDLSYNEFKSLPANIFNRTALAILHLKYNEFSDNFAFGNSDLQQLDLSFNSIQHVHHRMFDKMTGLTNLNLKGNGITKIQPDSFLTLKNLRHIDLSINELDQISSMVFYKNSELDVIRLNDNPKLSQLPTDGFQSYNGYFTVYNLDISNCAIGALGHKTFSTMPHLATLKLAWNNINNLERDTFQGLNKLTELDLSNNLIFRMDELMFMNNNDLVKLNLAGNPIRKLSVRLFLPLDKLRELDVSDCELVSLLADHQYGVGRKYKFFDTLRYFNASNNQIKTISSKDVKNFKNLRTLDIGHNPLKCNSDFQDFIRHVLLNTNIIPKRVPTMSEIKDDAVEIDNESPTLWSHLAKEVCGHQDNAAFNKKMKDLDERLSNADRELAKDSKNLWNSVEHNDVDKLHVLKVSLKKHVDEDDFNVAAEDNEDAEDEDDGSEYDEDSEDEVEDDGKDNLKEAIRDYEMIKNHGVKIEEIELSKEVRDKFLKEKFIPAGEAIHDDDEEDNDEEDGDREIYIRHQYKGSMMNDEYNILLLAAVFVCVATILALVAKCICDVRQKRGERYNMAMKGNMNSFVYQKLSEEIKPPIKEPKQPKVHKYSPLNPV